MVGDDNESLEERHKRLANKLATMRVNDEAEKEDAEKASANRKGMALGLKLSSEFISAIVVGALLGYFLDYVAGTKPWGMIILLLLGFGAGVLNVLRSTGVVAQPTTLSDRAKNGNGGKKSD